MDAPPDRIQVEPYGGARRAGVQVIIELRQVEKRHARGFSVRDVSLSVEEGETFVLLGRSGSGKTTTLKTMNRLVEPTAGTVRVFGEDVRGQRAEELRRRMGYVIQHVGLFPHYTVAQNVAVVPRLCGWDSARIRARVDSLLEKVGLGRGYADKRPDALSGGEQQRVGLARALAADPPIVLLDEPFGALDPITRRDMQREFSRLSAELGKTMVLVTHDVAEAALLGHRIALFEGGRIEQIGTAKDLLFRPASDVVRSFFDSHRLALELEVLELGDVAPFLSFDGRGSAGGLPLVEIDSAETLARVLEHPGLAAGARFRLRRGDEVLGAATTKAVLDAFDAYRRAGAWA